MKNYLLLLMGISLVACSSGLQEKAFLDNNYTYIVSRSLVNDRVTSSQPHVSGVFACKYRHTSEEMAEIRDMYEVDRSWYYGCQPIDQYQPGSYIVTGDQPIATLYKGPLEAAIIGGSIGTGLAMSGDTITQSNRTSAGAISSSSATGGVVINKGRHR